jgi:putative thiazole-containing bacteriocin maturation protein
MQPKLHGDTFYLPTAEGLYLRNSRQTVTLKGDEIYQWFVALQPYLNGRYTLEEIVDDLEPAQQEMVRRLVETLLAQSFVKDVSHDLPHTLDERTLATYSSEIAFIESFRDSAAATFERFRAQRMLLIGSGMTCLALVQATLHGGVRDTTIWMTDECETYTQRLQAYREQSQRRDPSQVLLEQVAPNWQDEPALQKALATFDVIFHLSDRPMLQRTSTLNRLCLTLQKPFFPALMLDDQALIGPLVDSGASGCWECAWRRWLAGGEAAEQKAVRDPLEDHRAAAISPLLGLPTAATVANMLSFECFKYLTEAGPCEINGAVLQLDLETLRCESHPFLPHPLCRTCQRPIPLHETAFLEQARQLEAQEPLEETTFSQRVVTYFDASLGIFTSLGEEDFTQMPLNVSRLTVSAPMRPEHIQETVALTRAHLTLETTRRRLTIEGAARYAARLVDQRRLLVDAGRKEALAYDLYSKQVRRVPAADAYPALNPQGEPSALLGVGAGLSWAEACARGALDHCLAVTLQDIRQGAARCVEAPIDAQVLDMETKHLHTLVEHTGAPLHIYQVTGSLGVPALAFCVGDETVTYVAHFDRTEALHEGLERVVQRFQSLHEEQPDYALPAVVPLPAADTDVIEAPLGWPALQGWQEGLGWLVKRLDHAGWRLAAVPLDHDPALTAVLPFLVHMLLIRKEA